MSSSDKPRRGAVVEIELLIDKIDLTPTKQVRAILDEAVVKEYAEHEEEWATKPIDVFEGDGKYVAGDGGHRIAAKIENGRKKILARVTRCGTWEDAQREAFLHAIGANSTHGLKRSNADKRRTLRSVLTRPQYATLSNREIAEMCRLGHPLVAEVRQEMTDEGKLSGRAASTATERQASVPRIETAVFGAATSLARNLGDGISSTTPTADDTPESVDCPSESGGRAATCATTPASPGAATVPQTTAPTPVDGRGRTIPACLVEEFVEFRRFAIDACEVLDEWFTGLKTASTKPGGVALKAILTTTEQGLAPLKADIRASVPYVVCPYVLPDGTHQTEDHCRVCQGRGWITKHIWSQLPEGTKRMCDDWNKPAAA